MERRLEVADVFRQHEQEFLARWGHTLSPQTSAHAKPPLSALAWSSVTSVSTRTLGSTRAATGTAQSVNPVLVTIGWLERQRNSYPFLIAMSFSRFPDGSRHWCCRIQN
jgi:hypothetical protein